MKLITIEQARVQAKADGDDDELLTVYCNAAEGECARLANRNLYATKAELDAALAGVQTMMTDAYTAYDASVTSANEQDDDRVKTMMLAQAQARLDAATNKADAIIHGIALDEDEAMADDIRSAILLHAAHLYRNRESVATGNVSAVEVPMTTQHIMRKYRWIGPL